MFGVYGQQRFAVILQNAFVLLYIRSFSFPRSSFRSNAQAVASCGACRKDVKVTIHSVVQMKMFKYVA